MLVPCLNSVLCFPCRSRCKGSWVSRASLVLVPSPVAPKESGGQGCMVPGTNVSSFSSPPTESRRRGGVGGVVWVGSCGETSRSRDGVPRVEIPVN